MIIDFEIDDREGEIDLEERTLDYTPKDRIGFTSLRSALNEKVMTTMPAQGDSFLPTKKYVEPDDETVKERVFNTLDALDAEYEEVGKSVSKSIFTDYVHREHKVREHAQEVSQECDECVRQAFREQVWPDDLSKSPSWQDDDDVTQQTQEWVDAVFELRDPIFDSYQDVSQAAALRIKDIIKEALTQEQGWSIDSVVDDLENEFEWFSRSKAETIARQEIAATLNLAQKISLEARASADSDEEEPLVDWEGPSDSSTTEMCEEIKREVEGGVSLSELEDLLVEKAKEYDYGTPQRAEQGIPHYQCRHSFDEVE